ncbi:ABC transporter permease [Sphaerisporangium sp. TRM90804]|uniref:ABC transporter permease n=1 Tax=Sphaerisporangium sp. TRM90804 TaxID=3031113 RepID=UPI00244AAA25|nr:ABC transporter permease [Sphaerisporangium sp. TRM90804]MDH2425887.1 ABC transporter permease [Sphaerisporangium sp. TRM90804]
MSTLTSPITPRSTLAVLERALTLYRRLWRASAFSSFLLPVMFLASIGLGVGGHIGTVDGVEYLSWIVPGVLVSTAFQMAIGECTYPVFGDFRWVRAYPAMSATPVQVADMVAGWLLYILIRALLAVLVFLGVTWLFGALHSPWALLTPLVCALVTLATAAPTMAFAAGIHHDGYFALLFRFVLIPSTLFAGVFFPVDQLPAAARPLAYLSPLWHGVELSRAATLGAAPPWPIAAHTAYLLAFTAAGVAWAVHAFRKRLQD